MYSLYMLLKIAQIYVVKGVIVKVLEDENPQTKLSCFVLYADKMFF
jgi:hypothetical protein